ncbi:MAG TPA: decarboxylating 6-phosphogluconate dehydrogenase [Candidatus Babeliales bacterium]|jgi:6-phosphogluconate dehydrogenase|nr:decarboxylating 6-phosphogluconate dehydrogenase [Candidatus Babeliales bacterium]
MNIAIIGLGKMGLAIAQRALNAGYTVYGYDPNNQTARHAESLGIHILKRLTDRAMADVSIVWLMIPAGTIIDDTIAQLIPIINKNSIIIDGGNSLYTDSVRRAQDLASKRIAFLDCGTSGGVHGLEHGFCLMVGGTQKAYQDALSLLEVIASGGGVAHVGPSGAGHYVKMIHNGIEYGLLQAYAEGFHLLHEGTYKNLDLYQIAKLWNQSSVIRSFILSLATNIFAQDQTFDNIIGTIAESGMGKWTVDNAHQEQIPVPVIETSLHVRAESRKTGGNYATKLVSLLREQFGGHPVNRKT